MKNERVTIIEAPLYGNIALGKMITSAVKDELTAKGIKYTTIGGFTLRRKPVLKNISNVAKRASYHHKGIVFYAGHGTDTSLKGSNPTRNTNRDLINTKNANKFIFDNLNWVTLACDAGKKLGAYLAKPKGASFFGSDDSMAGYPYSFNGDKLPDIGQAYARHIVRLYDNINIITSSSILASTLTKLNKIIVPTFESNFILIKDGKLYKFK